MSLEMCQVFLNYLIELECRQFHRVMDFFHTQYAVPVSILVLELDRNSELDDLNVQFEGIRSLGKCLVHNRVAGCLKYCMMCCVLYDAV